MKLFEIALLEYSRWKSIYEQIKNISPEKMEKLLKLLGLKKNRQRGSYKVFQHPDERTTVILFHKGEDLGRGLIRSILNDIDITIECIMKGMILCHYQNIKNIHMKNSWK